MSAGKFITSKYQAVYGAGTAIHPIKVQPETVSLEINSVANDPPAGTVTSPISARVSGGRRLLGLNANLVRLQWASADVPTGYDPVGTITVPLLAPAVRAVAIAGSTATYLGKDCTVVGTSAETVR